MITRRKAEERGHLDHGWLDAYHSFSFASYHDREHMGFGPLRVLNQDKIAPGKGFGSHAHRDMEIVTYVLEGTLEHKDDMGNGSRMQNGELQLMSAGSGVQHSEFNPSPREGLHLLQMWVVPNRLGGSPRYEQKSFSKAQRRGKLRLVVSPDGGEDSLRIAQEAWLYAGLLERGEQAEHKLEGKRAWLHLARGRLRVNALELGPGDGLGLIDETRLLLEGVDDAELILWEFPA